MSRRRYYAAQQPPVREGDNARSITAVIALIAKCFVLIPLAGIIVFQVLGHFQPLIPAGPWSTVLDVIAALSGYNLFVFGFVFIILMLIPLLWIFFGGENRPDRW